MDTINSRSSKILRFIAGYYLVILNTFSFFFDVSYVSPLKIASMSLAPLIFILKANQVSRALIWGLLYWLACLFPALLRGEMRFSTIGYLGLFVGTFITYYNVLRLNVFSLAAFNKLLRVFILAFFVCLVLQQTSVLIGIKNFPLINLVGVGRTWMSIDKLPSLSVEPSHTAFILTAAFLSYIRCNELLYQTAVTLRLLFDKDHRTVTIGFLWVMTTMGSGSAFLGLGMLCLYFVRKDTAWFMIPALILAFAVASHIDSKQLNRATSIVDATLTGNNKEILEADGSGATRIIPLLNTFTKMDPTKSSTWFGHGTSEKGFQSGAWKNLGNRTDVLLPVARQYGLIALIISIILVYSCCIRRFFSLETLFWFTLGMASIANVYFHWGTVMMFAGVRYFQERQGIISGNVPYASTNEP